jgi:hypothetical protein
LWYNIIQLGEDLQIEELKKEVTKERRGGDMKTQIKSIITVILILFCACPLQADTEWYSGHHEIFDGNGYGEIWMHNDATADMWGGYVFQLGTFDSSNFSMYGGTMNRLMVRGNSVVNIHSGELNQLAIYTFGYYKYYDDNTYEYIYDNGLVNLYAYDVVYHPTDEYSGYIEGKYINNDQHFTFNTGLSDISHINIVPEPATLLLLSLGGLLLRKKGV